MPKVLLVEDDNNLREIFQMRLQAEGYKTVTAGDGEEALVVAVKERPDLIIADVMMPKLSGFEMLETLRAAPEMKDVKVVMMTALGQAEDRARGEKLGVVKYLVKSQVTLEDFVRVIREVLPPGAESGDATSSKPESQESESLINKQESEKSMPEDNQTPTNPTPPADSGADSSNPISGAPSLDNAANNEAQSASQEGNAVQGQINDFVANSSGGDAPAGDSSTPAAPAGDSGSGLPAEQADVPVSSPPVPGPDAPSEPSTDQPAPGTPPPAEGGSDNPANNAL